MHPLIDYLENIRDESNVPRLSICEILRVSTGTALFENTAPAVDNSADWKRSRAVDAGLRKNDIRQLESLAELPGGTALSWYERVLKSGRKAA